MYSGNSEQFDRKLSLQIDGLHVALETATGWRAWPDDLHGNQNCERKAHDRPANMAPKLAGTGRRSNNDRRSASGD